MLSTFIGTTFPRISSRSSSQLKWVHRVVGGQRFSLLFILLAIFYPCKAGEWSVTHSAGAEKLAWNCTADIIPKLRLSSQSMVQLSRLSFWENSIFSKLISAKLIDSACLPSFTNFSFILSSR